MIKAHRLVKHFGLKTVLGGLDFEVAAGEFVALLGPNGAGKTTLLRLLASLARPTAGDVSLGGFHLPVQSSRARRLIGFLSHQSLLYEHLTAEENLIFYGRVYGVPDISARIDHVLEIVALSAWRAELVRTFSRGMQQRLAIARTILHDPPIYLLDEPYAALDQDSGAVLDALLADLHAQGRTIVLASHDFERLFRLAGRFDVLARGQIRSTVSKADLPVDGLAAFYREALA